MRNKRGVQQERYNTIGLLAHKNSIKGIRGITLIALVVTIVVLLILAGVSISLVIGQNGIISKAGEAKDKTLKDQENTEKGLNSLYDEMMEKLNDNQKEPEEIPVTPTTYEKYEQGEEVTVEGETFFVMYDSDENTATVTLFAKYNLNTEGAKQINAEYTETACAFSSSNYWSNEFEDTEREDVDLTDISGYTATDAIGKAKSYAESKGAIQGRLLTYNEAQTLPVKITSPIESNNSKYWLGTAYDAENVRGFYYFYDGDGNWWVTYGTGNNDAVGGADAYNTTGMCGVRPVIEIDKSLVNRLS